MHPKPPARLRGRRKATIKPAQSLACRFARPITLRNAKEITGYIQAMLADGDAMAVSIALRTVAEALGAFDLPPV